MSALRVGDIGDYIYRPSMDRSEYLHSVEECAEQLAKQRIVPLGLGGDHTVTLPLATGVADAYGEIQVLQLDPHHDYSELPKGVAPTHSNFISFLTRSRRIRKVVQVGVRGFSSLLPSAPRGVVQSTVAGLPTCLEKGVPVYVTIDTDALDPSLAHAVSHPLPRGLTWDQLDTIAKALLEIDCPVVGIDWTEYDPDLDTPNFRTGMGIVCALIRLLQVVELQRK